LSKKHDNLCVYPFLQLHLTSRGAAKPCCAFEAEVEENGVALSPRANSVDEIWNSRFMKDVRRKMIAGEAVPACGYCTRYEARGLESIGRRGTEGWANGWMNPEGRTLEQLASSAVADDYRVERPEWIDLHVGNACNLKCRMCCGYYSSLIAADPVHTAWEEAAFDLPDNGGDEPATGDWSRSEAFVFDDLLKKSDRPRTLNLIGGEPTLVKRARHIMRRLVESGAAAQINLSLTTNATTVDEEWCELAAGFRSVVMAASLDGVDAVNHYIRHPARWSDIEISLERLRRIANVHLYINATVQVYNVLDIVPLASWCEEHGLDFQYTLLEVPKFLSPDILPVIIRREASKRLRDHAKRGTASGPTLVLLAEALERGPDAGNPDLLEQFMTFTNDLDASRDQDFASTFPGLFHMLSMAGIKWVRERRFAK